MVPKQRKEQRKEQIKEAAMGLVCALHPDQKFIPIQEVYKRLSDNLHPSEKSEAIQYLEELGALEATQPPHFPGFFINHPE